VLGSAIHRGHQFMVHVDELIERIAVGLAEEAHQHGIACGAGDPASDVHWPAKLLRKGFLEVVIEPGQIEREDLRGLHLPQLGGHCRSARGEDIPGGRAGISGVARAPGRACEPASWTIVRVHV